MFPDPGYGGEITPPREVCMMLRLICMGKYSYGNKEEEQQYDTYTWRQ